MMYDDFVATCRELQKAGISEDFWSAVDLKEIVQTTNKPIYSGRGIERCVVFSLFEAEH